MLNIPLFLLVVVSLTMVLLLGFLHIMRDCEVPSDPTNIHIESFLAYYIHISIPLLVEIAAPTAFSFG